VFAPLYMDPSVRPRGGSADLGSTDLGSKVVIDATRSIDAGDLSLPARDIMEQALETWRKADLPAFEVPRRLDFRLDGA